MSVTKITESQSREIIAVLHELLERAHNHRLRAFAFLIKTGPRRHKMGFTGDYWIDPFEALAGVTRMEYRLNQLISSREGDPETTSMPLL